MYFYMLWLHRRVLLSLQRYLQLNSSTANGLPLFANQLWVSSQADRFPRNIPVGSSPLIGRLVLDIGSHHPHRQYGKGSLFSFENKDYILSSERLFSCWSSSFSICLALCSFDRSTHSHTSLAKALHADASYTKSRSHLRMLKVMRQSSLKAGALAESSKIIVSSLIICDDVRGRLVSMAAWVRICTNISASLTTVRWPLWWLRIWVVAAWMCCRSEGALRRG